MLYHLANSLTRLAVSVTRSLSTTDWWICVKHWLWRTLLPVWILCQVFWAYPSSDDVGDVQLSRNPLPVQYSGAALDLSNLIEEERLEAIALLLDCTKDCLAVNNVVPLLCLESAMLLEVLLQAAPHNLWSRGVNLALDSTSLTVEPSLQDHRRYRIAP